MRVTRSASLLSFLTLLASCSGGDTSGSAGTSTSASSQSASSGQATGSPSSSSTAGSATSAGNGTSSSGAASSSGASSSTTGGSSGAATSTGDANSSGSATSNSGTSSTTGSAGGETTSAGPSTSSSNGGVSSSGTGSSGSTSGGSGSQSATSAATGTSAGSASASTGGTSSTTTSGGSTGGLVLNPSLQLGAAVYGEFSACSGACPSPLLCTPDVGCAFSCSVDSDCPNPQTICTATALLDGTAVNACEFNYCDPSNPGSSTLNPSPTINSICNVTAVPGNDGTCLQIPTGLPSGEGPTLGGWACARAGTATTTCILPGPLSTSGNTCPQGQVCTAQAPLQIQIFGLAQNFPDDLELGECQPICDPVNGPACADPTQTCVLVFGGVNNFANTMTGACLTAGDAGCSVGLGETEYSPCSTNADCACPLICNSTDPQFGGTSVCQQICSTDSDCPSASDVCDGDAGVCTYRGCALDRFGNALPGTLYGACTVDAGNDGTCVPVWTGGDANGGADGFPVCWLAGTSDGGCDPRFPQDQSALCPVGQFCVLGSCEQLCNPASDGGDPDAGPACAVGIACTALDSNASGMGAGACLGSCQPSGTVCFYNGECCSGSCTPANDNGTCL